MQNLSNTKLLAVLVKLFVLLLIAKLIALLLWWYLPSDGVELNAKHSYQAKYQRVDFKNMLIKAKVVQATKKESSLAGDAFSIDSLMLKGLYGSKSYGFAIVAKKSSPRNVTIVSVGENYAGYKLKEIAAQKVFFTKDGKDYTLAFPKSTQKNSTQPLIITHNRHYNPSDEGERVVTREDIKYYARNPSRIWKDIAINPVRRNKRIFGFKISRIKRGSKMATLGLKKGDIMIRANNIELNSFNNAMNLYKKINSIKTIAIVVLRNNEEKEIIYDIN